MSENETDDGLTTELMHSLVNAVSVDNLPRKFAALVNGVSPKTFARWMVRGETGTGSALHTELAKSVNVAEGSKIGGVMTSLHNMAHLDTKAGEAYLRFFKPGDFGGPKRVADEFDDPERHAQRQDKLLDNPPPRLRALLSAKGWWQFPGVLSPEDIVTLKAIQERGRGTVPALAAPVEPAPAKPPPKPARKPRE